jgi:hypothetical protein
MHWKPAAPSQLDAAVRQLLPYWPSAREKSSLWQ